jgi:hypothetical protein
MDVDWLNWFLMLMLIAVLILVFIGLKFPFPRRDWPFNTKNTLILLGSITVFVLLFSLLNIVKNLVDWPSREIIIFWVALFCFLVLLLLGIFLPHGIRLPKND